MNIDLCFNGLSSTLVKPNVILAPLESLKQLVSFDIKSRDSQFFGRDLMTLYARLIGGNPYLEKFGL